jgi:hypothetical protein
MSEHPAQYARAIIDVELKRLYEQLEIVTDGEYPPSTQRAIEAQTADIADLKNKIRQLEMADFCLHIEL